MVVQVALMIFFGLSVLSRTTEAMEWDNKPAECRMLSSCACVL